MAVRATETDKTRHARYCAGLALGRVVGDPGPNARAGKRIATLSGFPRGRRTSCAFASERATSAVHAPYFGRVAGSTTMLLGPP